MSLGTSILFDVNSSTKSYPVYVSDSLLNTNTNFDYGQFLSLASTINAGTTVNQFIFQFNTAGVYVFQNSVDSSQQMVLAVMGSGNKCPDSSAYSNPMSLKALLLVGASQSSVVYEPNWLFICLLVVGIIVLIGILIGVYYYMRRSWLTKIRRNIRYRKVNLKGEDLPSIRDDNACFDYMQRNKDERTSNRLRQKMNREIRYSEIEDLRIRLRNHIEKLRGNIFGDLLDDDYGKDIELTIDRSINKDNIMLELQKLKDLIMDHKKNIEGEFDENYSDNDDQDGNSKNKDGFNFLNGINTNKKKMEHDIINDGDKQDDDELNKMMMQMQKRKEKIDKDLDGDFENKKKKLNRNLLNLDGDNDEDLRKKLLDELNGKLERVDLTLKDEEAAQMNALESKLAQRKKRRGKIVEGFNKLQKDKEDLTNNSALRNEIDRKCDTQIDQMEDELDKEREEGMKIIQENINMEKHKKLGAFEDRLKKATGDKKNFDKYLEEYTNAEKGIQDDLRREQMEQEKKLNDELKRRRDARLARIEADKGQMIDEAKQDIKEKLRDLEEKEPRILPAV